MELSVKGWDKIITVSQRNTPSQDFLGGDCGDDCSEWCALNRVTSIIEFISDNPLYFSRKSSLKHNDRQNGGYWHNRY